MLRNFFLLLYSRGQGMNPDALSSPATSLITCLGLKHFFVATKIANSCSIICKLNQWGSIRCKQIARWLYLSWMNNDSFWSWNIFLDSAKDNRLSSGTKSATYCGWSLIEQRASTQTHFCNCQLKHHQFKDEKSMSVMNLTTLESWMNMVIWIHSIAFNEFDVSTTYFDACSPSTILWIDDSNLDVYSLKHDKYSLTSIK